MAKKPATPKENFEEDAQEMSDREVSNAIGGVTANMLNKTEKRCGDLDEKLATLRGEKSAALTAFEEAGGSKRGYSLATKLMNMEEGTGRDVFRTMMEILQHRGFFNQLDMFENLNGFDRFFGNQVKVEAATPVSVGEGQAAAYMSAH